MPCGHCGGGGGGGGGGACAPFAPPWVRHCENGGQIYSLQVKLLNGWANMDR